jgi:hypothetical protein
MIILSQIQAVPEAFTEYCVRVPEVISDLYILREVLARGAGLLNFPAKIPLKGLIGDMDEI